MTSAESPNNKIDAAFKILIVDDNRDFVEFIRFLLSHHGFSVCWAYNGPDCLETVRKQTADLVVLDVMMPKMDGLAVCRELKQLRPSLPVILLTAKDDLATRAAAMALGVSEFLTKPVNIEDFLMRVRTQCHAAQWERNLDAALEIKFDELAEPVKPVNRTS
jgi:DNA-binding response OmpR family regulator